MFNRPYNTVLARLGLVAAILATLFLLAPAASAQSAPECSTVGGVLECTYAENGTDPVARFTAFDEDDDEVTWGVEGDDAGIFKISDAGVLDFKDSPSFETRNDLNKDNVYEVTVTATAKTKSTQDVEVTVTDVDEAGKVTLSQPQPQVSRGLVATGPGDPDTPVEDERWQWSRGPNTDGPWTDIANATAQSRPPVAADEGMYLRATVTYTDKFGAGKTASLVSENPVEERTVANAAPSFADHDTNDTTDGVQATRAVDEGAKGVNVGKPLSATDSDGDVLLYTIAETGTLAAGGKAGLTDGEVSNIRDLFSIDPRSGQIKTKVETLDSDDDGNTGTDDTNGGEVTYTFEVTATDPSGAPGTATVTVTITDVNDKPAFPDADNAATPPTNATEITIAENATGTALEGLTTYDAGDDDAGDDVPAAQLTYGLAGADASAFTIGNEDADRGRLDINDSPNFETKSSYSVTITATDDENATAERKVTVTVTNAEDAGEVSLTQREPQVGRSVVASLSDEDGSISGASWQWYRNAISTTDDAALDTADGAAVCADDTDTATLCRIDKATGPSYTPVAADAPTADTDTAAMLAVRVTYTDKHVTDADDNDVDDGDSAFAITQAAVQVSDPANTAPAFPNDNDPNTPGNQADMVRSVPENADKASVGDAVTATDSDGDLLIYTLGGADAMYFTIESGLKMTDTDGQIKTAMKLDYETKNQYMVVVTATDPSGASDSINVIINVTDADDPPEITPNSAPEFDTDAGAGLTVDENQAAGAVVGSVTARDADGDEIEYSLSGSEYFEIDSATGQIKTTMMLDYEDEASHEATVTASDGIGGENSIVVTITVINNTAPAFASETTERDVDENLPAGTNVGDPVTATDVDGDTIEYSLSGSEYFAIDADGQITTTMSLDYEAMASHTVTVTASDDEGPAMIVVTIMVIDNTAPAFDADSAEMMVAENQGAGAVVGSVAATDLDGDTIEYSLSGSGYFAIDENGQITATMSLDHEAMASHTVSVTASDAEGEDSIDVTISVTDMNPGCAMEGEHALTNDCETLLGLKDALRGSGNLDAWTEDDPITTWDYVVVTGDAGAMRVTQIRLSNKGDLNGEIPAAIGYLGGLEVLNLNGNDLHGMIPGSLGHLSNLTELRLHRNELEGIEMGLGGASSLTLLWAHQNHLSGTIPADLGDLDNLEWLRLDSQISGQRPDDGLTGSIPAELADMDSLERLYLHRNKLNGEIPAALGNSTTLTHITLQQNALSGNIPDLSGMTSLVWLGLYDNELDGGIPSNLGALAKLQRLYLHNNDLTGSVPASLGNLTNLTNLWLENNSLEGELPGSLDNLTNLERVRIAPNGFTGCVPAALANAESTDAADLGLETCSGS